jgi:predicted nucleotidyltransferase
MDYKVFTDKTFLRSLRHLWITSWVKEVLTIHYCSVYYCVSSYNYYKGHDMLEMLCGSRLRAKVLGLLMIHADETYYVRQLAVLLREDSTNVSRECARLSKSGILLSHTSGREKYYRANTGSPIFQELRSIAVKTSGLADVLRTALAPVSGRIRAAFIYGSFASGGGCAASDIDVMVIGDAQFGEIVQALQEAQARLNREVNPTVYSVQEFSDKLKSGHYFIARVMQGEKIFLTGNDHELAGLASK